MFTFVFTISIVAYLVWKVPEHIMLKAQASLIVDDLTAVASYIDLMIESVESQDLNSQILKTLLRETKRRLETTFSKVQQ